uniref:SS18 N-terminal domain-containing protein n=1 Tax=Chenopodium quinoa TaxID=63459 RepID=A0A803KZT7_CHEQI
MQKPTPSMMPVMPSFPPANITTEQIQKYLDENKKLILAILDNQNLGKLAECAQYQAQLQKNLMYLAAIADAQPQMATVPAQVAPHPAMQQGAYYMQQQAAAMAQQQGFTPRMPAHPSETRGGNKQDGPEAGSTGDGTGNSTAGAGRSIEGEPSYLKGSEEGK